MLKEEALKEIRKGLHNINNKLTAVTASCDTLLIRNNYDDRTRRYLQTSIDQAKQAGEIVYNLFSIVKKLQENNI